MSTWIETYSVTVFPKDEEGYDDLFLGMTPGSLVTPHFYNMLARTTVIDRRDRIVLEVSSTQTSGCPVRELTVKVQEICRF